ncbi:MAG: DNA repair protein RecN [Rhizomicrobium sp.]|jgi:DNA repair protein RecN (Recombination protein N)
MLATLNVRDLVLIEDVSLDFAAGLNVLTGETGAGKSILLDALGLAAGSRAGSRSSVRNGANHGSAVAIFDLPAKHPARALIRDNDIACDGEIILRRTIAADGRTRAFVNDQAVGVGLLRDLGSALVEIHGQADDRGLFDPSTHRRLLDAFGGHESLARDVADRFAQLEHLRGEAGALRRAAAASAAEFDYLQHAVKELSDLAPQEGEEAELAGARALMMNASRIAEDISGAIESISGDRGAESSLAGALKRLSRLSEEARAKTSTAEAALDQAFNLVEEARRTLEGFIAELDADPGDLERKEERLFTLRAVARKFVVKPDALPGTLEEFRAKLGAIEGSDAALKSIDARVVAARSAFLEAAATLTEARERAKAKLEKAVVAELEPLKLSHAKFRAALVPIDEVSATGRERVSFEVATVAGSAFGPLVKIASGGELARFSLALKVALAEASPPAVLIFDEVDRGVGGAVASAVGERLQSVARSTQTLLVTHSPQVAARAERHFRITRRADKTRVELLDDEERVEELARMLAGARVTDEARAAAKRLLSEARAPQKTRKRA